MGFCLSDPRQFDRQIVLSENVQQLALPLREPTLIAPDIRLILARRVLTLGICFLLRRRSRDHEPVEEENLRNKRARLHVIPHRECSPLLEFHNQLLARTLDARVPSGTLSASERLIEGAVKVLNPPKSSNARFSSYV